MSRPSPTLIEPVPHERFERTLLTQEMARNALLIERHKEGNYYGSHL